MRAGLSLKFWAPFRPAVVGFAAALAALGRLLFGPPDLSILPLLLGVSAAIAAVYGYNTIKDGLEDRLNAREAHVFDSHQAALVAFAALAAAAALSLPFFAAAAILGLLVGGVLYSKFRAKRLPLIKNLLTTFGVSLVFLAGAFSTGLQPAAFFAAPLLWYGLTIFAFIFVLSLLADIRDAHGDSAAHIRTLPVIFGATRCGEIALAALVGVSTATVVLELKPLFLLAPFAAIMAFLIGGGKVKVAHLFGLLAISAAAGNMLISRNFL